jgi:hypothetical protein
MKTLSIIILTFFYFQVQGQNWIGKQNFIDLYEKSDIVIIGKIITETELFKDSSKKLGLGMPLKSLTLENSKIIKGVFKDKPIYYRDIFNGCGYAPTLTENVLNSETLLFANVRNDSIFQLESMNESPNEIAQAISQYYRLENNNNSKDFTNWFFESSKNNDILNLFNHILSFKEGQLFKKCDSLNFSLDQRNWFYNRLLQFENYDYDNEGIISILTKYKDETYKKLLKSYLVKLANEPYSNVDDLMENIYVTTEKQELKRIIQKFKKDWRENVRKKLIREFIAKI